jgi:hypothetical protein
MISPKDSSGIPRSAEFTPTESSGSDVANAMSAKDITYSDIRKNRAATLIDLTMIFPVWIITKTATKIIKNEYAISIMI